MSFDKNKLKNFPQSPGVYLMKDVRGKVIYVGKAKVLKERVSQYFVPGHDKREQVPYLVERVYSIETIIVTTEKEALLLENTLIKRHQPKYNVFLKDDKSYISLVITHKHPWPMIRLMRMKEKPKEDALVFGPYTSSFAARQTLDLLNKLFPIRQCSDRELSIRQRPCILYEIDRCVAPCVGKCTKEEYAQHVERVVKFLEGRDSEVIGELKEEMNAASEVLDYEKAGRIHKTILQIEKTVEHQKVYKSTDKDSDYIALYREGGEVSIAQMTFKSGKLVGSRSHHFSGQVQEDALLLESFVVQEYLHKEKVPHEILLSVYLPSFKILEEVISAEKSRRVAIHTPQRGEKHSIMEMAQENAQSFFRQEKDLKSIRERILLEMEERFHLTNYPERIECFDTSHISGSEKVASMVVYIDGVKEKAHYRKFKIKEVKEGDDYAMMKEVLTRRYKRAKQENSLPDLLIVDGGKGQLNIAKKVLEELDIVTIDLIALVKEGGRHDKGMTQERVFLPNVKDPLFFKPNSQLLFLLQQIRDEAHRFAITFHRKRQNKKSLHSLLDDVPGIGPAKKKKLLTHFGSLKKIGEASEEQLAEVKGLSRDNIRVLREFFEQGE